MFRNNKYISKHHDEVGNSSWTEKFVAENDNLNFCKLNIWRGDGPEYPDKIL